MTHRLAAWIACCAMLFAALAPSLSHAMSVAAGEPWSEVCSVGGKKFVKASAGQGGLADPRDAIHLEHCPFCATQADASAMPPSAGLTIVLIETQDTHPSLFFQSPQPLAIWIAAQSRAPPSFS